MPATPAQLRMQGSDRLREIQEARAMMSAEEFDRWIGEFMTEALGRSAVSAEPVTDVEYETRFFTITDFGRRPKPNWLIQNLIEEGEITLLFGTDKVGKTAVLSDILWSWVAGTEEGWKGQPDWKFNDPQPDDAIGKTDERSVAYVLMEGQAGYYLRYQAWKAHSGVTEDLEKFYVSDDSMVLYKNGMNVEDPSTWASSMQRLWAALEHLRPAVLVIDTFSRATAGLNENSSEVAAFVGWLDQIRAAFGTSVIVVHHTPKDDFKTPRGHSSLKGAASSYVSLSHGTGGQIKVVSGPHRNAPQGDDCYVRMEQLDNSFYIELADSPVKERSARSLGTKALEFLSEGPQHWTDIYEHVYGENPNEMDAEAKSTASNRLSGLLTKYGIQKHNGIWSLVE